MSAAALNIDFSLSSSPQRVGCKYNTCQVASWKMKLIFPGPRVLIPRCIMEHTFSLNHKTYDDHWPDMVHCSGHNQPWSSTFHVLHTGTSKARLSFVVCTHQKKGLYGLYKSVLCPVYWQICLNRTHYNWNPVSVININLSPWKRYDFQYCPPQFLHN